MAEHIHRALVRRGSSLGTPLTLALETGSTNDDARSAARAGAPHGAAFVADAQHSGRGRAGHGWHSPGGENVYLSVVLRPGLAASVVAPLTLALGVAAARAIEDAAPVSVGLKWPNDLYFAQKKLGGILVEATTRGREPPVLVAGIGVNVHARTFPGELAARATSLALAGCDALDRSELVAALLTYFGDALARFARAGLGAFAADLAARDVLLGEPVRTGRELGVGAGIDAEGRLRVRLASGEERVVVAGEAELDAASPRPAARSTA